MENLQWVILNSKAVLLIFIMNISHKIFFNSNKYGWKPKVLINKNVSSESPSPHIGKLCLLSLVDCSDFATSQDWVFEFIVVIGTMWSQQTETAFWEQKFSRQGSIFTFSKKPKSFEKYSETFSFLIE